MSEKIDGRALAGEHEEQLRQKLQTLNSDPSLRRPAIVSFCNEEDPPSVMYTEMKQRKANDVGIDFSVEPYSLLTGKDELAERIRKYNQDPNVDGIMVQLPLPSDLNIFQDDLLALINPQKDVDGLTREGQVNYMPATVKAVISIMDSISQDWSSQKIAVVGATGEVGRPLVETLKTKEVDPVELSRNSGDLNTDLQSAQIIISATGQAGLIKPEMISEGVILIDVGLGDFDPECYLKANRYTPKFGGVGPMTVISLMENAVESFEKRMVQ